jgi:diguanylate cyclase (GGDEF)-like protein
MPSFDGAEIAAMQQAISSFKPWFHFNVQRYLEIEGLGGPSNSRQPPEWMDLFRELDALEQSAQRGDMAISDEQLPLLKRVLIIWRRQEADRIRRLQDKTHHPFFLGALDSELLALDRMTKADWFRHTLPKRLPSAIDLLPIQRLDELTGGEAKLATRQYDEKFHLLQSPALFLPDLEYYRTLTDRRGTCTSVAFLDIDNFKTFNADYNETVVDRNLLPRFMQLVESHVCFHGHAYRQGGDEYLVVLPGFSREFAVAFLEGLRIKISGLPYPGIDRKATVSIGLCTADIDCHLTNRELQEMANIAKDRAKGTREENKRGIGKNRLATYADNAFLPTDIQIIGEKNDTPEVRQPTSPAAASSR